MSEVMNPIKRPTNITKSSQNDALDTMMSSGKAWWNMMFDLQRASLQSFSTYSPSSETRISGALPHRTAGVEVIPVGEERLNVATRVVQGETTRVRRRVVEQPVEQEVLLRDEKVIVERRPRPSGAAAGANANVLTDTVTEMSDSSQVPTVWKSVHVGEEVVLRRQVTERTERVRETLRRDVVDVEHERAEVLAPPAPKQRIEAEAEGAKRHVEAQGQAVKQQAEAQTERKPANQDPQVPQPGPRKN
jgi:stress response protein YsnF